MQKMYLEFEHEVNGRKYSFKAEPNSPLVDAKEAVFLVMKDLGQIEDVQKKMAEVKQEENKCECPVESPVQESIPQPAE